MKNILEKSNEASDFLKLLANPNRLAILCCLHEQRYNVTELTVKMNMPQAAMSNQHTCIFIEFYDRTFAHQSRCVKYH